MEFHPDKCKLLRITNKLQPIETSYYMHNDKLDIVETSYYMHNDKLDIVETSYYICTMTN